MIARTWHGTVPVEHAEAFHRYLLETGVAEAKSIQGNCGVYIYRQPQEKLEHFFMVSYWNDMDAVKVFAGENPCIAVTYPEDDTYKLISDPIVLHHEVQGVSINFEKHSFDSLKF